VSPSRPSFPPQPHVFSANHRFLSSLFSYSYKSLFPQSLYFHIHTKPPGVSPRTFPFRTSPALCLVVSAANPMLSATCRLLISLASLFRARSLCFQQHADSFCKMRGVSHPECFYGTPGVGGCRIPGVKARRYTRNSKAPTTVRGRYIGQRRRQDAVPQRRSGRKRRAFGRGRAEATPLQRLQRSALTWVSVGVYTPLLAMLKSASGALTSA